MIPVLEAFKAKHRTGQLVVVADAGLMSAKNVRELAGAGYQFILAARIKNETEALKAQILGLGLRDGESTTIELQADYQLLAQAGKERRLQSGKGHPPA